MYALFLHHKWDSDLSVYRKGNFADYSENLRCGVLSSREIHAPGVDPDTVEMFLDREDLRIRILKRVYPFYYPEYQKMILDHMEDILNLYEEYQVMEL